MPGHFFLKIAGLDIEKNERAKVALSRSRIVGLYEYNSGRLRPAKRLNYLKELKHTDYPLDLNKGRENLMFVESQHRHKIINTPLNYAMSLVVDPFAMGNDGVELTRVYTPRRVLTHIMESYISQNNFAVHVSHYNGSIFMAGLQNGVPIHKQAHHLRLEKVLFSASPQASQKNNRSSDRYISLSALHTTTLGKYGLIYTGGVQGVIAEEKFYKFDDLEALNQLRFVQQANLANVDDIYVAYKNSEGIVESPPEHIKVSNIPENCTSWKPEICVGVLHEFLEKVEQLMGNVNSLYTVYTFYFKAKERTFYYNAHEGKTNKSFIPKYYPDFVAKET